MVETEKFLGRREGDEAACVKKSYAGAEEKRFANVVRDEDDGFVEAASKSAEFALKFATRDGIEGAEGFVHKKDRRVGGESARDAYTLTLAAREFAGTASRKLGGIEAY